MFRAFKCRKVAGAAFIAFCLSLNANGQANVLSKHLSSPDRVGSAQMSYLWWEVYDIHLLAPGGKWSKDEPFALRLDYLMSLKGKKIAERSIEEMRQLGVEDEAVLENWQSLMIQIFPDVDRGDSLLGVRTKERSAVFYANDSRLGEIKDPDFSRYFFGIWLDEKTSEPELRAKLLGQPYE